jgi:pimeloyl-ACP methyl ester carboxylesterase
MLRHTENALVAVLLATLAGCPSPPAPPPPDADTDATADSSPDTAPVADVVPVDPAVRAALYAEVHAYLTADDPGPEPPLLARLDTAYRGVPFEVVEDAVHRRPAPAVLPPAGVHARRFTNPVSGEDAVYHLYVPTTLPPDADRYPLLVFLHGAGGEGESLARSAEFQQAADRLGVLLVTPTSSLRCDWSANETCMSQVVLLVQHLKRVLPVDDTRVVLSGFSMGGRGSFSAAAAYPEPYCGVVPVAGSIGAIYTTPDLAVHRAYCCPHAANLGNLRLQYISGDQDAAPLLYQNRACAQCLMEQGSAYVYTELPGVGHALPMDRWEQAAAWTLERPRASYPTTTVYNLAPQASSATRGGVYFQSRLVVPQYWAMPEERRDPAGPATLRAVRSGNEITLTTSNVARASVYLAGAMVDLSAPVRVTADGRTVFDGRVSRDARVLLTEARARSERTMTFAARLELDLPEP